jgi:hypothetical protein
LDFCTRIHLFGNFVWMSCGVLVVFLFVELQLVRVATRGHSLVYSLSWKNHFEILWFHGCFYLKLHEELNLNQGLVPWNCEKTSKSKQKEEVFIFITKAPFIFSFFLYISRFPSHSHILLINNNTNNRHQQRQ